MIPVQYALRRRMIRVIETARLPKEYQEVEYIRSSGTQHIDTGFIPKYNSRVVADISDVAKERGFIFGVRTTSTSGQFTLFRTAATTYRSDYFTSQASGTIPDTTGRTIAEKDGNIAKLYDVTVTNTVATSGTFAYSLFLFACSTKGNQTVPGTFNLHSCQIYDNETLVRDYVPCYRKSDNVAGVYDLVNGTFYVNSGTGSFVVGPDVSGTITPPSSDFSFTYSGNHTDNRVNGKGAVRFNTSGVLNVTDGTAIVTVHIRGAGGGAAVYLYSSDMIYGASGGGGGTEIIEFKLVPGTYEIVIGTGGVGAEDVAGTVTAGDGGNTVAFGVPCYGGGGAQSSISTSVPGTGGLPDGDDGGINRSMNYEEDLTGGSPNGGAILSGIPQNGGDGYVEITFS